MMIGSDERVAEILWWRFHAKEQNRHGHLFNDLNGLRVEYSVHMHVHDNFVPQPLFRCRLQLEGAYLGKAST